MKENSESHIVEELEEPYKIDRNLREAKTQFWEFAKSRVSLDSQEEHETFHKKHFPDNEKPSSAAFVLERGFTRDSDDPEKGVLGFKISINKDFYGKEYADLIPYAIEHEVYEAWIHAKRGWNPASTKQGHLLARKHQLKMAMIDGKAERLVKFYIERTPSLREEFEDAYRRVKEEQ